METYIKQIFTHLMQNKSITPMTAFEQYGCTKLADVIYRLRAKGVPVDTNMVQVDNKRFARYSLSRGFIVNYKHQLNKGIAA